MASITNKDWITEWSYDFKPILTAVEESTCLHINLANIVTQYLKKADLFDRHFWKEYFNYEIRDELPPNIDAVLQMPCPFWKEKRVTETHMLAVIPRGMNLDVFTKLFRTQRLGNKVNISDESLNLTYSYKNSRSSRPVCILMPKEVIPQSLHLKSPKLFEINWPYHLPFVSEISILIMIEYIVNKKWILSFHGERSIYALCANKKQGESIMVGNSAVGLEINMYDRKCQVGVVPRRVIHL